MNKIPTLAFRNPVALTQGIGARLRDLRLARGWTQQELAERSGVALSTLKLLEAKGRGSLQRLARIAVALDADGALRELFAPPARMESLEAVRRTERRRAPRRKSSADGN